MPGCVIAYNEEEDLQCTDFNLGAVIALFGDSVDTCKFFVQRVKHRVEDTYMALAIERTDSHDIVAPFQLCCHVPFNVIDMGPPLGEMCALACLPTIHARLLQ